jgi:hypothetical protein
MKFKAVFMHNLDIVKLADYDKKLALIISDKIQMDTLEAIETLGWFVLSAIQAATDKPVNLDLYDVIDDIQTEGFENVKPLFEDYTKEQVKIIERLKQTQNPDNALGKSKKLATQAKASR